MKEPARARIAAIVGAVSKGQNVTSVYDYNSGNYKKVSLSIKDDCFTGYDYTTYSHFSGSMEQGNLDFYDYETSSNVQIKLINNNFEGYDYFSGKHFSGTVNGDTVSLCDYENGHYFNFTV